MKKITSHFYLCSMLLISVFILNLHNNSSMNNLPENEKNIDLLKYNPIDYPLVCDSAAQIEGYFKNSLWIQDQLYGDALASPTLADVNNNGKLEIIVQTSNSIIYILDHQGNFLNGWGSNGIVGLPPEDNDELTSDLGVSPHPLAINLDEDPALEIICATHKQGIIHAWNLDGTEVPGWDIDLNSKITSSLVAGDIDGDDEEEILVGTWNNELYAFEKNGSNVAGFPFTGATDRIIGTPALGNLDSDPELEIVFGAYDYNLYAIDGDGSILSGWPQASNYSIKASPAIADLNNDNKNEIIVGSWDTNLYIYHHNGSDFKDWPWDTENYIVNSASIADLNLDNTMDFVIQTSNLTTYGFTDAAEGKNFAWNYTQNIPINHDAIIADLDGNHYPEIIEVTVDGEVLIISSSGSLILRKEVSNKGFDTPPVIGDIDRDGVLEIIFATLGSDSSPRFSEIICYKLGGFGLIPWQGYRGGFERNGKPYDRDLDGLSDLEERMLSSNITDPDTDKDGLSDGDEVYKYALNPLVDDDNADTDGDLLTNVQEADLYGTNPTLVDSDEDNLSDGYEILTSGTDPNDWDTDNDLLPDDFEVQYDNPDPFVIDTFEDLDEDDLNNLEEYNQGTNPDLADTDGDGLLDGDEVKKYLTDPLVQDADLDSDGDGLSNVDEIDIYGTNPVLADTDGDGYSDGEEISRGSDPNDPSSKPFPLWALVPIIGGSVVVIAIASYFVIRKVYQKRRGVV